jgi:hypothetical protein
MFRELRIKDWFHSLLGDCHFAQQQIHKSPLLTAVAVFTLALGIGSSTAIFSAIDGTLLHPYPYKNAERLATFRVFSADQFRAWRFPARAFVDFKEHNHTFEDMFGLVYSEVRFTRADGTEQFSGGSSAPISIARATGMSGKSTRGPRHRGMPCSCKPCSRSSQSSSNSLFAQRISAEKIFFSVDRGLTVAQEAKLS